MSVEVGARLRVEGTVQGVGFRPYVYRLAHELGLGGFVLNDASGVLVEVEGPDQEVEEFISRLPREAPPLAVVERVLREDREDRTAAESAPGFRILTSPAGGRPNAAVTPDTAPCADCLRELFDPADRRYRYPFINCTNCGPRFTIVTGVPYDRPLTTMASFVMCERCAAEYADPRDRRFHAQPNACPDCGPRLALIGGSGTAPGGDPTTAARDALSTGAILAVKGIGGYHLACRAADETAVARLRARKHREDKPFALMVPTLEDAAAIVTLSPASRVLLTSPERPIVLAPRRPSAAIAGSVAPSAPELGVMLPYSPLHHLLVTEPLVMTSGNLSDEPIAFKDDDARERLARVADLFLVHDRPIETRTDDSIVRVVEVDSARSTGCRTTFIRRSRGYVPAGLPLSGDREKGTPVPLLACGAELKSTFCVAKGTRAWVSHHIGDLENYETLRSFTTGIEHFKRLFDVTPQVVAHDLHPDYLSTKYAQSLDEVELVGVQHHHAHLAACLAEHGESGPAIGAIFDGTGYGLDGTIWGGEILHGSLTEFTRVGSLFAVPLPGSAQAVREPWRMACSWLTAAAADPPRSLAAPNPWRAVQRLIETGMNSPPTTSMGRLFDAVAALCGVRTVVNYEGQAAIELEACCEHHVRGRYPIAISQDLTIDPRETIAALVDDLRRGAGAPRVAARFHNTIATATVEACTRAAGTFGTGTIVLSGGVFANRRLLHDTAAGLHASGLRVLIPQKLPLNDGGIAYGQAVVVAARMRS
jgi:hydrogenase maturation protein HypF